MESLSTGLGSTLHGGPKFKIQQPVPSDSVKKAPLAIVRSADLNDCIEIKRRFGEGSKPLFARHDIAVNQETSGDKRDNISVHEEHDSSPAAGAKSKDKRCTSNESSSPERYRHRDKNHTPPPAGRHKLCETCTHDKYSHNFRFSDTTKSDKYKRNNKSKSRSLSPSPLKKRPTDKVPYYRDEVRERDRLKRICDTKDRGRSRSRSIPSSKKFSPISKRSISSPKRRHSSSRDNYRRQTSYRSYKREYRFRRSRALSRSRRSRTRLRSRSPKRRDRESHKHSSRERDKEHRDNTSTAAATIISATPQFIHIPVLVPAEYAYSFPGCPAPQTACMPSHRPPPPSHFAPYPMYPMMAPMRPPHQAGYGGLPPPLTYGPIQGSFYCPSAPRFPLARYSFNNYQPHYKKPSS